MIKAVIIDDEKNGRNTLKNFISKYITNVKVVGEGENVQTGIQVINELNPDLVFLDIQMPDGTGFDLLERIKDINFSVIFVTAYDQYAVKAFKYSAVDYILKPVDPDMLIEAIAKIEDTNRLSEIEKKIELLLENKNKINKIALPSSNGVIMVPIENIIRCESDSNYTNFHLVDKKKHIVSRTLKEYDELLSDEGFFRTHKSHLINLKYVNQYVKGEGGYVVMEGGSEVEVSRRKKEDFLKALSND